MYKNSNRLKKTLKNNYHKYLHAKREYSSDKFEDESQDEENDSVVDARTYRWFLRSLRRVVVAVHVVTVTEYTQCTSNARVRTKTKIVTTN